MKNQLNGRNLFVGHFFPHFELFFLQILLEPQNLRSRKWQIRCYDVHICFNNVFSRVKETNLKKKGTISKDTVDGRNPAPVDMVDIPLFTWFCTSQVVVWDFFHEQPWGNSSPTQPMDVL